MTGTGTNISAWFDAQPPPLVPLPASMVPDLAGHRVVTGGDGYWRRGLRAVRIAHDEDGEDGVLVTVLPELDWHRANITREPAPAYRVPVDEVWVEYPLVTPGQKPFLNHMPDESVFEVAWEQPPPGDPISEEAASATGAAGRHDPYAWFDRLVTDRSTPPPRFPVRVLDVAAATGCRVVINLVEGWERGHRVLGEPYLDAEGAVRLDTAREEAWYHWHCGGPEPDPVTQDAALVWVE